MTKPLSAFLAISALLCGQCGALDSFPPSRNPFSGRINTTDLPQFVLLSLTGGATPLSYDLYRPIAALRHVKSNDQCPIQSTWYVSIAQSITQNPYTLCNLVAGLHKRGEEIATNTFQSSPRPTEDEIMGAVKYLNETCGVRTEDLVQGGGFRTPQLAFTQETFDTLADLGFLYDSSIADNEALSGGGKTALWPYTMDSGIAQDCLSSGGSCNQTKSNPGLWEIPLWRMFDENGGVLAPIDFQADPYDTLARNFKLRYEGNRAPLGINIHSAWLVDRGAGLKKWAEEVLGKYDDVFFVTSTALIEWMRSPVPASRYSRDCSSLDTTCFPPPLDEGGCNHGTFDTDTCKCVCIYPFYGYNCNESPDTWTDEPTDVPTTMPSEVPSQVPSNAPSASHAPSKTPTLHPTESPTFTMMPTQPTEAPTVSPTKPTEAPTVKPTLPPVDVAGRASRGSGAARAALPGAEGSAVAAGAVAGVLIAHAAYFF